MNEHSKNFATAKNMNLKAILRQANTAKKSGSIFEAIELYEGILKAFPGNVQAKKALSSLRRSNPIPDLLPLVAQKRYREVETILLSNIERDQHNPNFWQLLGSIYSELGEKSLAIQSYHKAIDLDPSNHDLMFTVATELLIIDDIENAFKMFKLILRLRPDFSGAHTNIGIIYEKVNRFEQAKNEWLAAIEIDPNDTVALAHLGVNEISNEGNFDKALDYFRQIEKLDPHDVNNCVNIASAYFEMGKIAQAVDIYKIWEDKNWIGASENQKNDFKLNYSLALFCLGQIEKGWENFSYRRFSSEISPSNLSEFNKPMLNKLQEANGKKVLILMEQGIGDQLFFLGLLKAFKKKTNASFIIQTDPRLVELLSKTFPDHEVTSEIDFENYDFDYWLLCGDMGRLLDFTENSTNLCAPYLKSTHCLSEKDCELFDSKKINIGIAWRSGLVNGRRLHNYTKLSDWDRFLREESFNIINLQYSDISQDLDELDEITRSKLKISSIDLKDDFAGVGALINKCDLVVGPMTAPIVQAMTQGATVISYGLSATDRWNFSLGLQCEQYDSLWYKNQTIFRMRKHKKEDVVSVIKNHILKNY